MPDFVVRSADIADRQRLVNLIHFEERVHRHLDWKPSLEWIGNSPFLLAEKNNQILSVLACPEDPPGVAWIRLFGIVDGVSADDSWRTLWDEALQILSSKPNTLVYALTYKDWFTALLQRQSFKHVQDVVVLLRDTPYTNSTPMDRLIHVRSMSIDDLPQVCKLDNVAFATEWRNSLQAIKIAFSQAAVASVAEIGSEIIGYLISTSSPMGGHLARLAVYPDRQGLGVGTMLVQNMLHYFQNRGIYYVTVNTQADNHASLAIYKKLGFRLSGETYPVFRLPVIIDDQQVR